jgi:hypothetical protein
MGHCSGARGFRFNFNNRFALGEESLSAWMIAKSNE